MVFLVWLTSRAVPPEWPTKPAVAMMQPRRALRGFQHHGSQASEGIRHVCNFFFCFTLVDGLLD